MNYDFLRSDGQEYRGGARVFPDVVEFNTIGLDGVSRNYIQMYMDDVLQESEKLVMPSGTFYITNDEEYNLFYKVESKQAMTKRELAIHIFEWLQLRNAYFNTLIRLQRGSDITGRCSDCANNLSVHGLRRSINAHNGQPVYNMSISS